MKAHLKKVDVHEWHVEDNAFWETAARIIAIKNLSLSIPCLLLAFAVWMIWSIIIVQMQNLGLSFDPDPATNKALFYTLPAIAGLAGATFRIPNSFLIGIGGGRNVISLTTVLLIVPTLGAGIALQNKETPYLVFAIFAALSGFGGGNFACSMSNISFFYPKRLQGTALGLNAGLGNFGVTTMQILVPLVMTAGIFGGESMTLVNSRGTLIGKIAAGTETYIHNAGYVWLVLLIPLVIVGWLRMNNIIT